VASALERLALEGIFGIFGDVGLFGFPAPVFGPSSFSFPDPGSGIRVVFDPFGGDADQPVLAPPVFEIPRGPTISVEPPSPLTLEPRPVSIFSDIVSVFTGPSDVNTGGGIFDVLIQGAGEIVRRQTTTAEERVLSGDFFEGDIARAIGNIGVGIATGQSLLQTFTQPGVQPVAGILEGLTGGGISVAPCPSPGGSQGFPAGSCITINDWQQLGAPKGFEVAGVSSGGTLILRKKRRRRRRGGLTKGMMTDVDYLARKLGKPAAETYLNRVL